MNPTLLVVIVVAAIIIIAAIVFVTNKRRSDELRERFGPEYDRAVQELGGRRAAEPELESRVKRVEKLDIRPLKPADRMRFEQTWRATQAHFVDDPTAAVGEADRLVGDVMAARGYPVGDFEQRAADVSVDHPEVVEHYRAAHGIAVRQRQGQANTEDLRQALVDYRALFDDLLETSTTTTTEDGRPLTSAGEVRR